MSSSIVQNGDRNKSRVLINLDETGESAAFFQNDGTLHKTEEEFTNRFYGNGIKSRFQACKNRIPLITLKAVVCLVLSLFLINLLVTLTVEKSDGKSWVEEISRVTKLFSKELDLVRLRLGSRINVTDEKVDMKNGEIVQQLELLEESFRDAKDSISLAQEHLEQNLANQTQKFEKNFENLQGKDSGDQNDVEYLMAILRLLYTPLNITTCGGSIDLDLYQNFLILRYSTEQNSRANMSVTTNGQNYCIWVIHTLASLQINLTPLTLNGKITLHTNFKRNVSATSEELTRENLRQEKMISSNIMILMFTPNPSGSSSNSGNGNGKEVSDLSFEIAFKVNKSSTPLVNEISVDSLNAMMGVSDDITYPPGYVQYRNNENRFYLIHPTPNRKVRLTITQLKTEDIHDYLQVFKFVNQEFQFMRRLTGAAFLTRQLEFLGAVNQPMLLYFHSDTSVLHDGFTANYISVV